MNKSYKIYDESGKVTASQMEEPKSGNYTYEDYDKLYHIPYFDANNGTFYEGMDTEQLEALNTARAVEIDNEYTDLIFEVEKKHLGKKMREPNYVYPQITLDEINRLRAECNQKILDETGLSDYNYRKSIPKLAY